MHITCIILITQGAGTRGGSGKCKCNAGYKGDLCDICKDGYYQVMKNETHTTCKGMRGTVVSNFALSEHQFPQIFLFFLHFLGFWKNWKENFPYTEKKKGNVHLICLICLTISMCGCKYWDVNICTKRMWGRWKFTVNVKIWFIISYEAHYEAFFS